MQQNFCTHQKHSSCYLTIRNAPPNPNTPPLPPLSHNESNNNSESPSSFHTSIEAETEMRPLSKDELLQHVLQCDDLCVDNEEWFNLMQKEPELLSPSRSTRAKNGCWKPNKTSSNPDAHKTEFKLLCEAAENFLSRVTAKPQYFNMGSKSSSAMIRTICNWMHQERNLKSEQRSAMSHRTHPEFWDYVKDDNESVRMCHLVSQKAIIEKAVCA